MTGGAATSRERVRARPVYRPSGHAGLRPDGSRTTDRDDQTTWATRLAQYDAVSDWGVPDHALLERVSAIKLPVFVANGDSDPMILPHYSYLLAGLIRHAHLKIYPDSDLSCSDIQASASAVQPDTSPAPWASPRLCGPCAKTCTVCGTSYLASAAANR